MADHRLHSLLGAANYRVNEVAAMQSPFVSSQFARRTGRAFETIGFGRVNSFVEMLQPTNFELFDISVVGGDSTEARMR
ncbi:MULTISPECIES: hypothetical protein [unclassified Mycobacterium]|uniref:hypothetical protein n=1 Tax=unclassified Mycobacterium TaxID=2642494 RepID=UPI0029C7564F|nr:MULTISPECIES: hypothetical protein [unclassified Mycobacterium]